MTTIRPIAALEPVKISPRTSQWYGWQPDLPDYRDLRYAAIQPKKVKLPKAVDLRAGCAAVENQGNLGSCTAHALVGALEFLEKKSGAVFSNLSRLFVYYNERSMEGTTASDNGAYLRDGIKTLAKQGVCAERSWPYSRAAWKTKPPARCYVEALARTIGSYHRLETVAQMRGCLAEGFPFVFGFSVYEGFESATVAKSGVLDLPQPGEKMVGGHAVLAVGYDDAAQRFLIRNSWGRAWGQHGYFTMPYAYLANGDLADDFWTIRV